MAYGSKGGLPDGSKSTGNGTGPQGEGSPRGGNKEFGSCPKMGSGTDVKRGSVAMTPKSLGPRRKG